MYEVYYVKLLRAILGNFIIDDFGATELPPPEKIKEGIDKILTTLTPRQCNVIKLRYGIDDGHSYTPGEISFILKTTRENVRQAEAKAIRKLNQRDERTALMGFLQLKQPTHKVIIRLLKRRILDDEGAIEKSSVTHGEIEILLKVLRQMKIPSKEYNDLLIELNNLRKKTDKSSEMRHIGDSLEKTIEEISSS